MVAGLHHLLAFRTRDVLADLERALCGDLGMSPLREGWLTGLATAFGAAIPVFPFLVWQGMTAIVIAFAHLA